MGTAEQKRGIPAVIAGALSGIAFALIWTVIRPECAFFENTNAVFFIAAAGLAVGGVLAGIISDK